MQNLTATPAVFDGVDGFDGFDLDPMLLPVTDTVNMAAATDDGCGSTCGACTTNA